MIVVNRNRGRPSRLSLASFLSLSLQVLSKDNLCAGYVRRVTRDEIADTIG